MFISKEEEKNPLEGLLQKIREAYNRKFVFLLVGRTGVGKSSTVNSLMGEEIAQVGDYEPTTMKIEEYDSEINDVQFKVIDTPGLCDDLEELNNDYKYLDLIRREVKQIDLMWFVSRLDETRVTSDEKRGIKLISEALGESVWKKAVIVFTFANSVDPSKYPKALEKRTELIRQVIANYIGEDIANNIPSVAVDNKSYTTPDGQTWLGELYTTVFTRISKQGALPFFISMVDSIKPREVYNGKQKTGNKVHYQPPRIKFNERQKVEIKKTIDAKILPGCALVGAAIGSIAGPMGAAIGGAIGAVLGAFAWFF